MATYKKGASVIVAGLGPGVVTDVTGAPNGHYYRVTLTESADAGYGFTSAYTANETELTPASALPTYKVGDRVVYQNRLANVVAVDPATGNVVIVCEPEAIGADADGNGGALRQLQFALPAWQVHLQQIQG